MPVILYVLLLVLVLVLDSLVLLLLLVLLLALLLDFGDKQDVCEREDVLKQDTYDNKKTASYQGREAAQR